jgi:hypothetical protein
LHVCCEVRRARLVHMAEGDLRHFINEVLRHHELATEAMVGRLDEQRMAFVALQGEIADMRGEIADQRKQIQANTQAVLSVLDRLN